MTATLYPVMNSYRSNRLLNGTWNFKLDPDSQGMKEQWFNKLSNPEDMPVPGSFAELTTDRKVKYYTGDFWYEKDIFVPKYYQNQDIFIRFGSITHRAQVFLNGEKIAEHEGGFLPFAVNITEQAKLNQNNHLAILVNNELSEETIPCGTTISLMDGTKLAKPNFDFFNYSGIMRNVWLVALPKKRILDFSTEYKLSENQATISYQVETNTNVGTIKVELFDKNNKLIAKNKGDENNLTVTTPHLWSPDDPYLYTLKITLQENNEELDEYSTQIGIRTVKIDGEHILLNNHPIKLKGFGKHEDFNVLGKAVNESIIKRDFECMKWIGANCFRTSHYPYAEEWYQYADKYGFLIIDEVPAVGMNNVNVNFSSHERTPFFKKDTVDQLKKVHEKEIAEMITRDKNHPSVIAWSLFNEPESTYDEAYNYFKDVFTFSRKLDPQSRPLTGALVMGSMPNNDKISPLCDFICLNRYYGWYIAGGPEIGNAEKMLTNELQSWKDRKLNKPFVFTEFGADTLSDSHQLPAEMWSQEYQEEFTKMYFDTFAKFNFVQGALIWNFADFKTSDGIIRAGGNQKGIFTRDREPKQVAYLIKKIWQNQKIY